ncbi:MAG: hypothetical protein ACLP5H_30365 [Desulfomonilaceae bacterium]
MGKRYNELRSKGKAGQEATDLINEEFEANIPYSTIRGYGLKYKQKLKKTGLSLKHGESEERSEREEDNQRPAPRTRGRTEKQPIKVPDELMPVKELDDRMRLVAREVFQEMLHNMRNERNVMADAEDSPPEPETLKKAGKGRRENRNYVKASVTVDKVLWDLFTTERDHMRVSTGRLMDIILWRHFNRPKLSFEQ